MLCELSIINYIHNFCCYFYHYSKDLMNFDPCYYSSNFQCYLEIYCIFHCSLEYSLNSFDSLFLEEILKNANFNYL